MLSQWLIMLPEFMLIMFIIVAALTNHYRQEKTPKTFFTLAQLFLLSISLATLVFYNKSPFPALVQNTPFVTLFKICGYLLTMGWMYLSSKWFLNKNRPSCIFCMIIFFALFGLDILASSVSFVATAAAVPLILLSNCLLISQHWDIDKVKPLLMRYILFSSFFCLMLWIAVWLIFYTTGSLDYLTVKQYFSGVNGDNIYILSAIVIVLAVYIYMLGLVPFHIWFTGFIGNGVLPVCGFITLVPPLFYICAFIKLIKDCFAPFYQFIAPLIITFAVASILVGAVSAKGEKNIRRLFAYLNIYCWGVCLLSLVDYSSVSIIASFAYIITVALSFAGIYTIFLGLKSHSEYLSEIEDIRGFTATRPYMAAALMIFMFSFIGLAPTLGFLGYMSIINNLMSQAAWLRLGILLCGILLIARTCLDILRLTYFENSAKTYDRPDKSIYICLFINMTVILLSLFNPNWLLKNAVAVLGGVN